MSSTSNAQDLLVNVFRPTYRWEAGTGFVPSLVVSNVTEVIASTIKTDTLVVSDSNVNTYIGSNAGVNAVNTLSNVGIGYSAMGGALNSDCNVAIGTFALDGLAESDSNVAIGAGTDISGTGVRNVLIGTNVALIGGGSNNILIGADLSRSAISNTLQIGSLLYGNLSNGYIGINTPTPNAPLDVSGTVVFRNKVGIQTDTPVYSLDVMGSAYVSNQVLTEYGVVGTPAYSFVSNQTTGIYRPTDASYGTGALGVAVSGKSRLVVADISTYVYGALDVCGAVRSSGGSASFLAEKGLSNVPAYAFTADASLGFYYTSDASGTAIGIAVGGQRRLVVGSNKTTMFGNLDVCGSFSAVSGGGGSGGGTVASNGTVAAPSFTFSNDSTTGLYLAAASNLGFATGGSNAMIISNGVVKVNSGAVFDPAATRLDVDGNVNVRGTSGGGNLYLTGLISNGIGSSNTIGGVTLYYGALTTEVTSSNSIGDVTLNGGAVLTDSGTSNSIGGVTLINSNVSNVDTVSATNGLVSGYLRNALTPTTWDISDGNVSNSGVHTTAGLVGTYIRNALTPSTYDISGGNISNSNSIQTGNPADKNLYATMEIGKGYLYDLTGGTPAMAFQYVNGGYRHFIRSRHLNNPGNGNGIDFFLNTNGTSTGSTAPGTGNVLSMSVTATGVGIAKTTPDFPLDVSGTMNVQNGNGAGTLFVGGSSTGVFLNRDVGGNGYLRAGGSGVNLYLGTSNSNTVTILSTGLVGLGTTAPSYALDVSAAVGTPSLNLSTWPRIPLSNAVLAKGVANTNTIVGNTLNINTVVRTINSALATFTASNATSGGSLLINKAGIWSIMLVGSTGNGTQLWMDVSTNNHSNIGVYTNGNPVLSVAYTPGSGTSNNTTCTFMGFLPSNVYVKPRLNGSLGGDADIVWRFNAIFHAETDAVTTWPF